MPSATTDARGAEDLATLLRTAVHLHQTGQLQQALPLYREALHRDPDHPDALHLSGILAHQTGRSVEALELIDRALARLPGFADAHNSRGNLLRALGRPDDALGSYRQAIALAPSNPLTWSNLGNALRELGRPEEALRAYREAIAREPELAEAHLHVGLVLRELGQDAEALAAFRAAVGCRPDLGIAHAELGTALRGAGQRQEAVESYRRAVSLEPGLISAYCELGATLWEAGEYHEAADALQAALALDPERPEAHNWMGKVCKSLGYLDQALSAFRQALAGRPDYAEAHFNLGVLLGELHRPVEAVASYRAALTFRADYTDAYLNMGVALLRLGRAGESITAFRRALELRPGADDAWYHLGRALQEERRCREAVSAYDRAIAITPDFPDAHWNRAQALLALGDYPAGWQDYEWRWKVPELRLVERRFTEPRWNGTPLHGRTILVHAEQGASDTLLFARFIPMVAAKGGRVILECEAELTRLLEAMPELAQVVARGEELPPFDCHIPLEDLAQLFGTRLTQVPGTVPYLPCQTWSGRIPMLPVGEGLRIGIVWSGDARLHPERSLPLRQLAPLFRLAGISWYSLQAGDQRTDLAQTPETRGVHDLSVLIRDLTDVAALAGQLDLIISVDTALAHLAGGLGLPLWVLLPAAPDWRWNTEAAGLPWYPTARAFRQPRPGDWGSVVEAIGRELETAMMAEMP
jgi:tetratricopeptide (TPR) repeat protein